MKFSKLIGKRFIVESSGLFSIERHVKCKTVNFLKFIEQVHVLTSWLGIGRRPYTLYTAGAPRI